MDARHEHAVAAEHVEHRASHARHQPHARRDVGAVGYLDADVGNRAAQRTHRKRHDVHRAPAHAAVEEFVERCAHGVRSDPVIGRSGVFLALAADEGAILDPRDVGRMRPCQIAVRPLGRIELAQCSARHHRRAQALVFLLGPVAPDHPFRARAQRNIADPAQQPRMSHVTGSLYRSSESGCWIGMIHRRGCAARRRRDVA